MKRKNPFFPEKQKRGATKLHWKDVVKSKKQQPVDHMIMSRCKEVAGMSGNEWFTKEQAVDKLKEAN